LDNCGCFDGFVGIGIGELVHHGRIHSYSARGSGGVGSGSHHSRATRYKRVGKKRFTNRKLIKGDLFMKKLFASLFVVTFCSGQSHIIAAPAVVPPLYQVTVVQTPAKAINYRNMKGSAEIDFKGTVLLPAAKGEATVKNKAGVTDIKAEFENLSAPTQFGPEYLTYIFWAISPDGRATNLGEIIVNDGKGALNAKTPMQAMSLLVTAEPYFAVSQPSNVVILENAIKADDKSNIVLLDAKYELLPRGQYTKNIAATDMKPEVMDKKTPFNVYQARNAVKIAKAAGADTYAADGYKNAERLLALSETKEGGKKGKAMTAREAVQAAEDSRAIAVKRQADEFTAGQISNANNQAASATADKMKAEEGRVQAETAKAQSDAERAAALALATSAAASSTDAQADAKAARASADKSKAQADVANSQVQKVEGEKAVLRAQLLQQLNAVLQTQDTARGLIVNMSGALFQTGSATLQPSVREKLAKIAGIVSSHPGLTLSVEGHTDSIGSDGYNQTLSEKRAQTARDYLVSQGVSANSISSMGFGKSNPIESNDTANGRAKNRRVEIVVSGDAIGSSPIK
jgi:outer membrane protein OmpA-like peptidoglycan-associated protein